MGNDYDFGKEKVHISSEVLTKTVNSYFTRNVHTHLTTNINLAPERLEIQKSPAFLPDYEACSSNSLYLYDQHSTTPGLQKRNQDFALLRLIAI